MQEIINKAKQLTAKQIMDWLRVNFILMETDGIVIDAMLCALETKIHETEYLQFIAELDAML